LRQTALFENLGKIQESRSPGMAKVKKALPLKASAQNTAQCVAGQPTSASCTAAEPHLEIQPFYELCGFTPCLGV